MKQRPARLFGPLSVGPVPRVVGTISRAETLAARTIPAGVRCDLIEVRLDKIGAGTKNWLALSRALEAQGRPVILTIRLAAEGGDWSPPDADRAPLFAAALADLAAIDVEQRSPLLPQLAAQARDAGKAVIVSSHDFVKTPSLPELRDSVAAAMTQASVVKVATMINRPEDVATLRQLLEQDWDKPLAVMGMGPGAAGTRPLFARLGSCLTYGYLDQPVAPGQPSAAELTEQLSRLR